MNSRKQTGCISKRNGFWILRYRETSVQNGQVVSKQKRVTLAPVDAEHRCKTNVRDLPIVSETLAKVNAQKQCPETVSTLGAFMRDVYLPFVTAQKKPSTVKGYQDLWENHLQPRWENKMLWTFKTKTVQDLLQNVADTGRTRKGEALSKLSLAHLKSFVSGIFKHAAQQGFYDGINPATACSLPPARKGKATCAYTPEEISAMLAVLPEPARTVVAVAAFTGARRGEIEGLTWEALRNEEIYIEQSIWNGIRVEPKTRGSKAPIPVCPQLALILERYKASKGDPTTGPMFRNRKGGHLQLNNVLGDQILPALNRCGVCLKAESKHGPETHEYRRDVSLPEWRGWHGFRRGLASNLYRQGIADLVIQRILRHAQVSTTQQCYIKTSGADAVAALAGLNVPLCPERVPEKEPAIQ